MSSTCACAPLNDPVDFEVDSAESWEEADALFLSDSRWIGGDGALTIPLGGDEVLWLFGDSFIATSDAHDRSESELVHNSIAIQHGLDPTDAEIEFVWRTQADGSPGPFFADEPSLWFWPGHGIRLDEGPLVVFLMAVRAQTTDPGFAETGYRIVVVDDPDASPLDWQLRWFDPGGPAADPDVWLGTSVLREGDDLYAVATARGALHEGRLARFSVADVIDGRLEPMWWTGDELGWQATDALGNQAPTPIIDDVGSENSVHFEPDIRAYLHIASRGFGSTTIAARASSSLTGPFARPKTVFIPPESLGPDPFVYAAKAHPILTTGKARELVVTYATNSFEFDDLFTEAGQTELYYPRFVVLRFARRWRP